MRPDIGNLGQPVEDQTIRGDGVEYHATHAAGQWIVETLTQIAVETFDLAFGPCPIRATQPGHEAKIVSQLQQSRMETVRSWTVGIPFEDNCLHVVKQDFPRNPTEIRAGRDQPVAYRLEILGDTKLDEAHPAITEGGHERRQGVLAPERDEVDLHLLARSRLEPNDRTAVVLHRFHRRQIRLELRDSAAVAAFADLAQQYRRR